MMKRPRNDKKRMEDISFTCTCGTTEKNRVGKALKPLPDFKPLSLRSSHPFYGRYGRCLSACRSQIHRSYSHAIKIIVPRVVTHGHASSISLGLVVACGTWK